PRPDTRRPDPQPRHDYCARRWSCWRIRPAYRPLPLHRYRHCRGPGRLPLDRRLRPLPSLARSPMIEAGAILVLIGALFSALAALGVLRFPDIYTRMHAASKAGPLGAGLILLGAGLASGDLAVGLRCFFGFTFLILTSP